MGCPTCCRHQEIHRSSVLDWWKQCPEDRWKPLLCQSSCPVKNSCREPSPMGILMLKNYIRSCKSFGGPVKLGFSMWWLVLRSGKGPNVFPMSAVVIRCVRWTIQWGVLQPAFPSLSGWGQSQNFRTSPGEPVVLFFREWSYFFQTSIVEHLDMFFIVFNVILIIKTTLMLIKIKIHNHYMH